jgi:adenine nucleotide transporter 17
LRCHHLHILAELKYNNNIIIIIVSGPIVTTGKISPILRSKPQRTNRIMPLNDTIASEALAAAVGGAISSGVLYPLEVLKTRMQAEDNNGIVDDDDDDDVDIGDKDNGGEENQLISQPKKSQSDDHDETNDCPGNHNGNDGSRNSKATAPTSIEYARNLYRSEGMRVFFDGMEVSAFQSAIEKACYFFAYTALKRGYAYTTTTRTRHNNNPKQQQQQQQQLSALSSVLLGCLAEWVHLPITLPIDALTTAIQTSGGSKKKNTINSAIDNHKKRHTVLALWMTLWKEKSFYKGIQAYWILCFKPALQYTIFEQCKAWIVRLRQTGGGREGRQQSAAQLSAGEAFLLGMFSRTIATLVVFPFVRAKVRMQSLTRGRAHQQSSSNSSPADTSTEASSPSPSSSTIDSSVDSCTPPTIWKLLAENYTNGGVKALYQGLGPELTRGVLSAALMMMVKERISGGVKKMLHGGRSQSPLSS